MFQVVHFYHHQTVIAEYAMLLLVVVTLQAKADTRQVDGMHAVEHNLPVGHALRLIKLILQAQIVHPFLFWVLTDHVSQLLQAKAVDHLFLAYILEQCYFHDIYIF